MQDQSHLDLADARVLIDAAIAAAEERELTMSFTVVDAAGHVLCVARMDGANWLTPDISRAKAFTAAGWRAGTGTLQTQFESGAPFLVSAVTARTGGEFMPQRGGVPVVDGERVVGAIGASGGSAAQDEEVVTDAVAVLRVGRTGTRRSARTGGRQSLR